jgi:hypothetical protein
VLGKSAASRAAREAKKDLGAQLDFVFLKVIASLSFTREGGGLVGLMLASDWLRRGLARERPLV